MLRKIVLRTAAIAIAMAGVAAYASDAREFNIPPGELAPALESLARQTGLQLIFQSDQLHGIQTRGITGRLSAEEAVVRLLEGTNFTIKTDSAGAMLIVRKSESAGVRTTEAARGLEEIIVTAQKREERLIDVPISVVALGGEELKKRGISGVDDLRGAVPGLSIQSTSGFQRRIMLRGIGNVFGNQWSSSGSLIGMYLDEAAVTSNPAFQMDMRTYDLERIEELRGPQGTLYGAGSAGGTIRFITESPKLDRFRTKADVAASFTEKGSPSQRIDAMVNVPLIENELGLRISGTYDYQGGWVDQPAAGKKDYNDQNLTHVRVKGLWQPTSQFSVNAMAVLYRNDSAINLGEDADGNFTQTFVNTTPSARDNYDIYNLTLAYDFAAARLLSTTTYSDQAKVLRDYGTFTQLVAPPAPRTSVYYGLNDIDIQVVTQEVRLTSQGSGPLEWTAGGFYRRDRSDNLNTVTLDFLPIPPGAQLPPFLEFITHNRSTSAAVFGDASYQLTARLKLGVGLRYFEDDQEDQVLNQARSFDALSPRVYAQYKWADNVSTYGSAGKGFRSGGFNQANQPTFDPESVWTYELGAKMSLADGRVSVDAALFYSDYTDYQIVITTRDPSAPLTLLQLTSNAGDARIQGVEWGVTWHPAYRTHLTVNGSLIDSEFYKITGITSTHAVGDPVDLVPKYTYTASAEQEWALGGRPGSVRVDYSRQGRSTYRNRLSPWIFSESDVLNLLSLSASLQWNENLSLGLFAQNLLNDRGYTDPFSIDGSAARSRPRTFGVQFGVSFD